MINTAKLLLPCLLLATTAFAQAKADIKVGTAMEKYEVTGASDSFTVAPNTKLYAGTKVSGIENDKVTVVFLKDGKEASKVELKVPRNPYRTHAYKTIRAGDSGAWTVKVLAPDGSEIGSSNFQVQVSGT
jgi:nitrogen fixation protein FixH